MAENPNKVETIDGHEYRRVGIAHIPLELVAKALFGDEAPTIGRIAFTDQDLARGTISLYLIDDPRLPSVHIGVRARRQQSWQCGLPRRNSLRK